MSRQDAAKPRKQIVAILKLAFVLRLGYIAPRVGRG